MSSSVDHGSGKEMWWCDYELSLWDQASLGSLTKENDFTLKGPWGHDCDRVTVLTLYSLREESCLLGLHAFWNPYKGSFWWQLMRAFSKDSWNSIACPWLLLGAGYPLLHMVHLGQEASPNLHWWGFQRSSPHCRATESNMHFSQDVQRLMVHEVRRVGNAGRAVAWVWLGGPSKQCFSFLEVITTQDLMW